jgi:hypothetical protein
MTPDDSGEFRAVDGLNDDAEEMDLETFMQVLLGQVTEFRNAAEESIEDDEISSEMSESDWWELFFNHFEADDEEE